PALELLRDRNIPLIFCTSKTRAEVEDWRDRLASGNHPFIVENGGGLYVPAGYFPFAIWFAKTRGDYELIQFGDPYEELVRTLAAAAAESGCTVRGFADMTAGELARVCNLPARQAELARQREYDEPFEVLSGDPRRLTAAIESRGKRCTRGGRFYHITGNNDKGMAVMILMRLYYQVHREVISIGLGDSLNDLELLSIVDVPVAVRSPDAAALGNALPNLRLAEEDGPGGWNRAVLEMVP
ncbi:MAG: HAD hydrolase family protein, partial [Acidobacteria bacterium]|nr:HAD hydrolase family protein [Acidobacteriota bacterium]